MAVPCHGNPPLSHPVCLIPEFIHLSLQTLKIVSTPREGKRVLHKVLAAFLLKHLDDRIPCRSSRRTFLPADVLGVLESLGNCKYRLSEGCFCVAVPCAFPRSHFAFMLFEIIRTVTQSTFGHDKGQVTWKCMIYLAFFPCFIVFRDPAEV